jgi:hypothetical protein
VSIETKNARVVFETDRHRIVGEVTLPAEGLHNRLSDLLNREGVQFISLIHATISGHDGENAEPRPFVAVALEHIQLAYEAD